MTSDFLLGLFTGWLGAIIGILFYLWATYPIRKAKDKVYYGDYK